MTAPTTTANVLNHQVGQHVEYWAYFRAEVLHRGVVTGWFWTQDDDDSEPYKVYCVALTSGGTTHCVHDDTYADHAATRAAVDAWHARIAAGPGRCRHCASVLLPDPITQWIDDEGHGDCPANPESINHETEQDR